MRFPGFIGGSNTSQSLTADSEKSVNLYVEPSQGQSAKSPAGLMPTPGFSRWAQVTADVKSRGSLVADARAFAVIGGGFYEFTSAGAFTRHGSVPQDSNPAQLVYN